MTNHDVYEAREESRELRALVSVLGNREAQDAAQNYLLGMYLHAEAEQRPTRGR